MTREQSSLRIGVTQRHIAQAPTAFARDALDSGWSNWFGRHLPDAAFLAIPNFPQGSDAVAYALRWQLNALILSGGEDVGSSPLRDTTERALLDYARTQIIPVIGICRGMQLLQVQGGGDVQRSTQDVGKPHAIYMASDGKMEQVNSWHSFAVQQVAPEWVALATAEDASIELMRHATLPWLAMMWHPERLHGMPRCLTPWLNACLDSAINPP